MYNAEFVQFGKGQRSDNDTVPHLSKRRLWCDIELLCNIYIYIYGPNGE